MLKIHKENYVYELKQLVMKRQCHTYPR